MPLQNTDQFIELLRQSNIASPEVIELWLERAPDKSSPKLLANFLLKNEYLTRWQRKFLLSGRHKFIFGNYLLLELVKSNVIGELFFARHTRLNQLVNILFLAKPLSAKLEQRKEVLRLAAAAADINHPNLAHLHTIERSSGRYLIVTDHVDAKSLNDTKTITQMTLEDVPNILTQLINATAAAHANGLSHGTLSEQDVLYSANGNVILQNAVSSFLVHNLSDDFTGTVRKMDDDVAAIEKIGCRLLRRFDGANTQPFIEILQKLGMRESTLSQAAGDIAKLQQTSVVAINDAAPRKQASPRDVPNRVEEIKRTATCATANDTTNAPAKQPNKRPAWMFPAIAAALLAIVSGISFWKFGDMFGNPLASVDGEHQFQPVADNDTLPSLSSQIPQRQNVLSNDRTIQQTSPKLTTQPELEELAKPNESDSENAEFGWDVSDDSEPASKKDRHKPDIQWPISEPNTSILSNFESIANATGSKESKNDDSNSDDKQTSIEITQVPTSVDLTPPTVTDVMAIATFSNSDVRLELISDENISKNKTRFTITGNSELGWLVKCSDKERTDDIAKFEMQGANLNFAWSTAAKDSDGAGYLKNCILKANSNGENHYICLRKPIIIEGFQLERSSPKLKIDLKDIPFVPKRPFAELHELDPDTFGPTFLPDVESELSFSRKEPLILYFRELPEYQLLFLTLTADLKNRWRLEAQLQMRPGVNHEGQLASDESVEQAKRFLAEQVKQTEASIEYLGQKIDVIRSERGLTPQQFSNDIRNARKKEQKKLLELFKEQSREFRETLVQLEPFFEQPIPVSIYFEVDGQRVVLATTVFE